MRPPLFIIALVLGLALCPVGLVTAYDFSPEERALADNPPAYGSNQSSSSQWYRDHQQQIDRLQQEQDRAARQSQENDRLHRSIPQFNPQGAPGGGVQQSMPWTVHQNGHASVCRRGVGNSVMCSN